MHVFVTGATGWVGSAIVNDLIAAGHQVTGMARSDQGAATLQAAGAAVHRGSLEDLDSLRSGAAAADGVIHTAFNHDFSRLQENCEEDRRAIEAIGSVLEGSRKKLLVTSGVALLAPGRLATEADMPPPHFPRKSEAAAVALAQRGVRAATIRLAPTVHGHGDHGFVPILVQIARDKGVAAYVGDGSNRWPAVHRLDAARVYRLALEQDTGDSVLHAIAEEGIPMKHIAEIIGRRLNLPVVSQSPEEASEHFGWFAMFVGADFPTSGAHTRAALGWEPTGPGFIEDFDHPAYFT